MYLFPLSFGSKRINWESGNLRHKRCKCDLNKDKKYNTQWDSDPCGLKVHRVWGGSTRVRLHHGGSHRVQEPAWRLFAVGLGPGPARAQQTRSMAQAFLIPGAELMADCLWTPGFSANPRSIPSPALLKPLLLLLALSYHFSLWSPNSLWNDIFMLQQLNVLMGQVMVNWPTWKANWILDSLARV